MLLALYLTNKCNVDRGFCYDWVRCHPSKNDDIFREAPEILQKAKELGITKVAFSGGEPTLYFDQLLPLIEYSKSLGFYVQLKTNGWWGTKALAVEYAQALRKAGLDHLRISFDSRRFYLGSPLTQQIFWGAVRAGFDSFYGKEFTIVGYREDPNLDLIREKTINYKGQELSLNVEDTPKYKNDYRLGHEVTGLDPDDGVVKTVFVPFKNFRITVDPKKRVFATTEGIAEMEIAGILGDRYLGEIGKDKLEDMKDRLQLLRESIRSR